MVFQPQALARRGLYRHQLDFESPNDLFNETRTGAKVSLTRALGSDFLIGSVHATVEDVGISQLLNPTNGVATPHGRSQTASGDHLYERFGASLAYDTRNSVQLPNHGQRSELSGEFSTGDQSYYKLELTSSWYFPGFLKGHVLEIGGRAGVADSITGGDVPFFDRYYLGGLYSMRGFKFRDVSPRESRSPSNRSAATLTGLARSNTASRFLKRTAAWACALPCSTTLAPSSAASYSFYAQL